MSSTQTAAQDLAEGLSSDLKLTNIVALATMTAAMIVILLALFETFKGLPAAAIDDDTVIAMLGGTAAVLVVYIAAQAATGGAYVNAVASLTGVNVVAGATPPAVPSTNTTGTQITGANLSALTTVFSALTPAQIQAMTPTQLAALVAATVA